MTTSSNASFPHLILGGAKSGKSTFAETLMAALPQPYVYVATAEVLDDEMAERVRRHQQRRADCWETIECPLYLVSTLQNLQNQNRAVLVDCLTLWLTNLLLKTTPTSVEESMQELCQTLPTIDYPLLLVANEVGGGIVPENALARRFRDLAGWLNQQVAAACHSVTLVVAGLPLPLKQPPPSGSA